VIIYLNCCYLLVSAGREEEGKKKENWATLAKIWR